MEDYIQLLVFAAFALFSLISGLLNRNKDKPPKRTPPEEVDRERTARGDKPVARQRRRKQPQSTSTLDDILRELTGQGQPPTQEEVEREQRRLEEERAWVRKKKEKAAEHFEEASDTLKTAARQARKSPRMADKISLEDDHKRIQPLTVTPQRTSTKTKKKTTGAAIARSLRNPRTAKHAIILSEILQRKHF